MNKIGILLGIAVLAVSFAVAPIPLTVYLQDPTRDVTIYPNLLFVIPLILLGTLLLLYGITYEKGSSNPDSTLVDQPNHS